MTRKFQYVGFALLTVTVVTYLGSRSNYRLPTHANGFFSDKYRQPKTANVKVMTTSNLTRDLKVSNYNESTFGIGLDKTTISRESHAEDKRLRETEHLSNIDGPNGFSSLTKSVFDNSTVGTPSKNLSNLQNAGKRLEEKRHIAFLKVHKAASTTLQTMFFRFGYERNLSFVLPVKGHYFSRSSKSHEHLVRPRYGDHYDIICNHGFFNHKIYSGIMPNDSVYLAVVRKPFDQFVSAVNYYIDLYKVQYLIDIPGNRIENLIKHPEKYDKPLSHTMNSMARDFGFNEQHFFSESSTEAKHYLEKLGSIFDFVLIAEYFDESLIIMKRLLNWSLKDILYISKNVRGSTVEISDSLMKLFKVRNRLDFLVYDFFYEKFNQTLKKSEKSVLAETEYFRRVLKTVQHWCIGSQVGELTIDASKWNEKFLLLTKDCQLLTKKELSFIRLLKQ